MVSSNRTFNPQTKLPKYQIVDQSTKTYHRSQKCQNSKKPLKLHIAKVIAASRKFYRQRSLKEDFLGNVPLCMKIYRHENTRPISRSEMEGH